MFSLRIPISNIISLRNSPSSSFNLNNNIFSLLNSLGSSLNPNHHLIGQ